MPKKRFRLVTLLGIRPDIIRMFKLIKLLKQVFEASGQVVTIIMVPSNHFTAGNNEAIGVGYGDDIAGFGLFSTLIRDRFAPFFAALWLPSRLRIAKFSS